MDQNLQSLLDDLATLRNFIDDEKAKLKPYEDAAKNLGKVVLAALNEVGVTSAKATGGHRVETVTRTSLKVVDREAFFDFVFASGDDSFLQARAGEEAVAEYLKEHNELPPGIEMESAITLRFTRTKA